MFIASAPVASDPVTQAWIEFVGHLHPLVLHFPLALLLVGTLAVVWNWFRGEEGVGEFAFHCLWIGAAFAVLASVSGWFFAEDEGSGKGLELHRWFAVSSTVAAVALAALASLSRTDERPGLLAATRLLALLTAGSMAFTGHVGGEMVWGEGAVTSKLASAVRVSWEGLQKQQAAAKEKAAQEPKQAKDTKESAEPAKPQEPTRPQEPAKEGAAPKSPETTPSAEPAKPTEAPKPSVHLGAVSGDAIDRDDPPAGSGTSKPADGGKPAEGSAGDAKTVVPPPVPPKKPVSWKDDLLPLLKDKCFECHSGEKPKDGVAFDHVEELIKKEGKRAVVMKGDPSRSTMFGSVMKPDTSKKRMPPPKKGPRLTPEQAGLIEAWIKEGARIDN